MSKQKQLTLLKDLVSYIDRTTDAKHLLDKSLATKDSALTLVSESALNGNLIILGEIVKNLDDETKNKHPEVDWAAAGKMRDFLAHHYYKIDKNMISDTVVNDLPGLRAACIKEIDGLSKSKTHAAGFGL